MIDLPLSESEIEIIIKSLYAYKFIVRIKAERLDLDNLIYILKNSLDKSAKLC